MLIRLLNSKNKNIRTLFWVLLIIGCLIFSLAQNVIKLNGVIDSAKEDDMVAEELAK